MTQLYKNIYRIRSDRLQYLNYANKGIYFITICTKNRKNYFGDIVRRDSMLGVSNLTNEENAMLGVSNLTNEENDMLGVSNLTNEENAMPSVSNLTNDENAMPGVSNLTNEENVMPTVSNLKNDENAMLGVSNLMNEENVMPGDSANNKSKTDAMPGVSNLMNEENAMPGVSANNISNRDTMLGVSTSLLQPTEIGKIAHLEWHKTKEIRSDMNLELGEFIVMPNHIHGIIIIGSNNFNNRRDAMLGVSANNILNTDAMLGVSANNISNIDALPGVSTNNDTNGIFSNQFAPQSKNLASIIRGYKSAVTTFARKNKIEFDWQPRFHEHIIRSESSHKKISNYIINNPILWKDDKFHNTA
ncbi:MAG: hypothetical protein EAZ27_12550 [Cytophagales bacterium]|nr:MAG: hypothetical protein EAZ27_12550 [Cytophagales bacterium]